MNARRGATLLETIVAVAIAALIAAAVAVPTYATYSRARTARDAADALAQDIALLERSAQNGVDMQGATLEIDSAGARRGPQVPVGRVCIDSGTIDEVVEDIVIRDRRHLSEDGFVLPIIAINKHTGKSEGLPEIVSRGFMSMEDSGEMILGARQVVMKTLDNSTAEERGDWGVMQEKIRADLKRYLTKQTSRRPLIMPVILEV